MNVISKLARRDKVSNLRNELEQLKDDGLRLLTEIERAEAAQLDATEADDVIKHMAAAQAARNRITKLDAKIAEKREALRFAEDEALRHKRDELVAIFASAARKYLTAAHAAREAFDAVITARDALAAAGFVADHAALPVPPGIAGSPILAADLLENFEHALAPKTRQAATPAPTAKPGPLPPPPSRASVAEGLFAARAPVAPGRARRAPRRDTVGEGERQFHLMRGTIDHPRVGQMQAGDVVALRLDEAAPLIMNGAGDFVTPAEVAAMDATLAPTKQQEQAA